ncbi:hypothetical protein ACSVDE_07085 [Pseudalkalibacillus sp. Hm43]|uniref:hypothetical protein n=1 Tax=Pseudalkalibacillus sp. Hm43 TaxID=3450742 RepID=UPI003F42BA5B
MGIASMCIAVDVKDSRKKDKEQLRLALLRCAEYINDRHRDDVLVPFDVRNGDELLGVIESFRTGFQVSRWLEEFLSKEGIDLYIGIGLGVLDTQDSTIHTMNGSAVLNALDARDRYLKDKHQEIKPWIIETKRSTVFFYSKKFPYQALNALNYAITEKKIGRSEKQKEVIGLLETHPDATYEQIGQQLGYKSAKSTVSYLLSRAQYHTVIEMENSLMALLGDMQDRMKSEER